MEIKIKVVGQPMYNIGDLAACKSLTKLLQDKINPKIEYSVFENRKIDPEFQKINGVIFQNNIPVQNKYAKIISILNPKLITILSFLFPQIKRKYDGLLNSDFVLFSPGGLEFGLYKEWDYLWMMSILIAFNKNFGIYSRSIGDFQEKTILDTIFKKKTIKYLKHSKFNGLRDQRSQNEAKKLGIPFFPSIDVVFSNIPEYKNINKENLQENFGSNYIVFTPSAFDWHPKFSVYDNNEFRNLYLGIMNTLLDQTDLNIVMLPHFYKENSDSLYFNSLRENSTDPDRVFVIGNNPDPDLYQFIISKAKFAIMFRLHQTIFAINNHTPFFCVSYEHKMEDMLRILGLLEYSVRLQDLLNGKVKISNMINKVLSKADNNDKVIIAQVKANKIALDSFKQLSQKITNC